MSEQEVRIVKLEPLRVASAYGFGESPEIVAWDRLFAWAKQNGLAQNASGLAESARERRFFGFNNPSPTPGSPNYGYEQWMTVGPEVEPAGEIRLEEFPGGLYAVLRCQGVSNIPGGWTKLVHWLEDSPYQHGKHQWLEEALNPLIFSQAEKSLEEAEFDLYLPVEVQAAPAK